MKDRSLVCMKCGSLQQEEQPMSALPDAREPECPAVAVDPVEREFPVITVQPQAPVVCAAPMCKLKTNRGLIKYLFLSVITCGIYAIVTMSDVTEDINIVASRYDGKRTMHYCLIAFLFSWLTLGIAPLVWVHRMCDRIGNELARRGIAYRFGAGAFWGWNIFGTLLLLTGPFIYRYKLLKAMNQLCEDYNARG